MRAVSNRPPDQDAPLGPREDIEIARAIADGSIPAWHCFLERYSDLLLGVVRRHLFAEDEDDMRAVHVDILKALHDADLGKFRGDASLATWLVVYARSRSLDFLRRRYGRRRPPKWYEQLSDLDRDVLRFFFVQRLSLDIIVELLRWGERRASVEEIVRSIEHVKDVVDPRQLAWIESEQRAKALGIHSQQMLGWMIQMRLEYEERSSGMRPDRIVEERRAAEIAERLREALARLPEDERRVMTLRFERGQTAAEISEELGLGGERKAFTIISRIVRKLRRALLPGKDEAL